MKTLQPIENIIINYLEGTCTEDELRCLSAWLDDSPRNREEFFEVKNIFEKENVCFLSEQEINARWLKLVEAGGLANQGAEQTGSSDMISRKKKRIFRSFLRYAAVVIAAAFLGYGTQRYIASQEEILFNEMTIEAGNKSSIILSDGTKVTLNASTTLRYPSRFGRQREVWLDGEAFFEVASDTKRPFIVYSQQQAVEVLGTSFNVQAYRGDVYNTVTLLSGSVTLKIFDAQGNRIDERRMEPYEQYRFDLDKGLLSLNTLDNVDKYRSWTDGIYRFRDEKLAVIVSRLEFYYGIKIRIADEQMKNMLYTGAFPLDQPSGEVFSLLNYENKFVIKIEGRNFVLDKK